MDTNKLTIIKACAEELLTDLGVDFSVTVGDLEGEEGVSVNIESPQANLLIGYHAEALNALQYFVGLMAEKKIGEWTKVIINIGDYRQRREEQLRELAMSLAQKAVFSGEPQIANNLTPSERRIVHIALADHSDVVTESVGEGRDRHLMIKPKTPPPSE